MSVARPLRRSPYDREILRLALPAFGALIAEPAYVLVDTAVVGHLGFSTAGEESPFTVYHSQRNLVWAWVKNMPTPLLLLYLPQHLLVNLLNIGYYTARGQAGSVLRSKVDALRGLPAVWGQRRELQPRRTVSARELRTQMETGAGAYLTGFKRAWATWRRRRTPQTAQSSRRTRAQ